MLSFTGSLKVFIALVSAAAIPRVRGTLTDWELGALHEWIEDGAFWPDNPDGFIQPVDPLLGKVQR